MQPGGQGSWYVTYHRPDSIAPTRRGSCGDPIMIPGDPAWLGASDEGGPPPHPTRRHDLRQFCATTTDVTGV